MLVRIVKAVVNFLLFLAIVMRRKRSEPFSQVEMLVLG
jgi:hypothetical protein